MEQYREKNKFTLWQYPLLISHLEEMAQKGHMLSELDGNELVYDQCEPQKVHFAVTFFPDYDFLDPVPPPALERLWEFCDQNGWQHITDNASMQIFCSTATNPVPLHTDAVVQLDNFNAMMKIEKVKNWKSNVITSGITTLFIVTVMAFAAMDGAFIQLIKRISPVMLILFAKHIYTFLADGAKWLSYHRWYKKAKELAAQQNIFYPPKENIALQKTDTAVLTAFLVLLVFFMFRSGDIVAALVWFAVIFGIMAFYILVLRTMKEDGVSAKENRTVAAVLVILLIIVLIIMLPFIIMLLGESGLGVDVVTMTPETVG